MKDYSYPKPDPCKCGCKRIAVELGRAKANLTGLGHWCRCRRCNHEGPFQADKMDAIEAWDKELK